MPAFTFSTATVQIGQSTKKSDYDRLLNNTRYLASGTNTVFTGQKTFNSGTIFKRKGIFTATAIFNVRTKEYNPGTGVQIGTLFSVPSVTIVNSNPLNTNTQSATCSAYIPTGAKAVLLDTNMIATDSGMTMRYYRGVTSTTTNLFAQNTSIKGGSAQRFQFIVGLDSNGKYYWKASNAGIETHLNNLVGYFI
jgi:hypothetical protein